LNGYQYVINQSMPQIAASNVTVAFGDMSKFIVRKVSGWSVQRLVEAYATTGQVGFLSHMRVDSQLIANSGLALNVLQQHS
jgi:HK97 family phage major capsid protein